MAPPVPTGKKWVYPFGPGVEPPPPDRNLLGGKGKGLADMSRNLPVPPGFIISTEACVYYRNNKLQFPPELEQQIFASLEILEKQMGSKFGDAENPLLVSCRSGARVSMPGMMETILDLGLNDQVVLGFAKKMKSDRVAYDSYRRFIAMYANVVDGVNATYFDDALKDLREKEGVQYDISISAEGMKSLCTQYKDIYQKLTGRPFPQDPREQLMRSVQGVFHSWDCQKAIAYRRFHRYPDDWGTAVIIMAMVFGNRGDDSASGVGFTRDPATGDRHFYGEFLPNSQGEDVVAGIRTPHPVNRFQKELSGSTLRSLEEMMPELYQQLEQVGENLEKYYHEMQDVEFTIDSGRLFMLQTRTGKRTGFAAVRIACEMLQEGLIDEREAVMKVDPAQLSQLLTPVFDLRDKATNAHRMLARGLNAGPGAACGKVAFTSEKACEFKARGEKCVLLREETSPEDFSGIVACQGILTMRGGATSHAAVVARGLGKPCVCGCGDLSWDEANHCVMVKGEKIKEGDVISIDGTTGQVFLCELKTKPSEIIQVLVEKSKKPEDSPLYQQFITIMKLADKFRTMGVRTNADTPNDAAVARAFGAEGIGLVRTEHMFMEHSRLLDVRCMMFAESEEQRKRAVEKLMPHQKGDFAGIFRVMRGLPVTIRLLDPPRHEFLPHTKEEEEMTAKALGVSVEKLRHIADSCAESNPMLGHRGCRLGIAYPYLTEMQVRAIFEAALEVTREDRSKPCVPEIMVPIVADKRELVHQRAWVDKVAQEVFAKQSDGLTVKYSVGTMIELPRAALQAGKIAESAEFFSFGTNDLTQCTFGISRDDAGQFLPLYLEGCPLPDGTKMQVLDFEPFQTLDTQGVGELMQIAIQRGRATYSHLKTGICGEHGGDGPSVKFCHTIGLNYVSCSPFRVAIARLAAAQAAIEEQMEAEKRRNA